MKGLGLRLGLSSRGPSGPSYGPELITNGDFSAGGTGWITGGGWTISGGQAVGATATDQVAQIPVFTVGQTYRVTFDYTMSSGSGLRIDDGVTNHPTGALAASGSVVLEFVADGVDFRLEADNAAFTGTVDNISAKRVL